MTSSHFSSQVYNSQLFISFENIAFCGILFAMKKDKKTNKKQKKLLSFFIQIALFLTIFTLILGILSPNNLQNDKKLSLSELARDIKSGKVEEIVVRGDDLFVYYTKGAEDAKKAQDKKDKKAPEEKSSSTSNNALLEVLQPKESESIDSIFSLFVKDKQEVKKSRKESNVSITETLKNYGVSAKELQKVKIKVEGPGGFKYWMSVLIPALLPILVIFGILYFLTRGMKSGPGMQPFSFGKATPRFIDPNDKNQKVTFKDVAGAKEAKEELKEIVDFLKNPKKFLQIGARIPKGVLLMGSPGTGKTLLARAVAGEAKVPFFSISGSEFVEMFVGVGASRVRDLFQQAKKHAPSIIFIDEIDAVGRARGSGIGGGNDEREQTLNQILVEMDGFEPNDQVIVMAATNRPDVLDPALLRPGRFDRRVVIDLPDRKDREEILKIHARKKPLHADVDLKVIAERTPGFSGADLANLMNEAAILAARENRKEITQYDLIRSIEKVMLGPERKSHVLSEKEKKITAYHEAGHAIVASVLEHSDPVHKISIISRGKAAGYTLKLPLEDKKMHSKKEFLDDIATSLGGYIAEEMIFGDVTTGPSNDLQVLTNLARSMVAKWGMSEKLGTVAFDAERVEFGEKPYSEDTARQIDEEVRRIIDEQKQRVRDILTKYKDLLDRVANELMEKETLERDEFNAILKEYGIKPKTNSKDDGGSSKV